MTIRSQIIKKLNPIKSPRSPPQSATNERYEYDSISFSTVIFELENLIYNLVSLKFFSCVTEKGVSVIYNYIDENLTEFVSIPHTLYSI